MAKVFDRPELGPLKIYQQSDVLNTGGYAQAAYASFNPNYNNRGIDKDFFHRNIKSWMDQVLYWQPYQQGDMITEQWQGVQNYALGPTVSYVVRLLNENGDIQKQMNVTQGAAVGAQYVRGFYMPLYDVPEGRYLVQIHKVGLFTDYDYFFIAEGIEVKKKHENTILFTYYNSFNDWGAFFDAGDLFADGFKYQIRLHAALAQLDPQSEFHVYKNQPYDVQMLSGMPHREWLLALGVDNNHFPEWMLDKINRILLCDTVYADDLLITKTESSNLDPERIDKHPLVTAKIAVAEKENDQDLVVEDLPPIVLGDAPESEWFAVDALLQVSPANTTSIRQPFSGAQNFVDYLNSVDPLGIFDIGHTYFAIDTLNRIVLITDDTTVYGNYSAGLVMTNVLEGHLLVKGKTSSGQTDLVIDFANTALNTMYMYFWGDGSNGSFNLVGTANDTVSHTYAADKKFTAYLFWNKLHNLALASSDQIIESIEGKLPIKTKSFNCENNQLRRINNNIFSAMDGACSAIQLSGSKLGKYAQNDLIRYAYENKDTGVFDNPATIDMQSQNPVQGPSGDPGISLFKTELANAGITIQHD